MRITEKKTSLSPATPGRSQSPCGSAATKARNATKSSGATGQRATVFIYEDGSGNIDIGYPGAGGNPATLDNYITNDDAYHAWAIDHDGSNAKITCDGNDVIGISPMAAAGIPQGVTIGGGTDSGKGKIYVSGATYEATLAPPGGTTALARIFDDHMVLQRDMPVAVFGTDPVNPGGQTVTVTFAGQSKPTTTDSAGSWRVNLDPLGADPTGRDLVVTGSSSVTISDVLVGEVWLAAGQENMNFPVGASASAPSPSTYPLVRMCNWEATVATGDSQVYGTPEFELLNRDDFYAGTWQALDATTVQDQSAVAYFFAHDLAESLSIPIGIVDISTDGTSTEAYIPASAQTSDFLLRMPFEKPGNSPSLGQWTTGRITTNLGTYSHNDPAAPHPHPFAPGFLYETGLTHIAPFTFKGAVWYQGESNAAFATAGFARNRKWISDHQYHVMETLVASWRSAFENPRSRSIRCNSRASMIPTAASGHGIVRPNNGSRTTSTAWNPPSSPSSAVTDPKSNPRTRNLSADAWHASPAPNSTANPSSPPVRSAPDKRFQVTGSPSSSTTLAAD